MSTTDGNGGLTRYQYDALNRLTAIVGQSGTIGYTYDRSGLTRTVTHSNGVASSSDYDAARRIKRVLHTRGASNLSRTDYEYDRNGNRLSETINRSGGAQATTSRYDGADRLEQSKVVEAELRSLKRCQRCFQHVQG